MEAGPSTEQAALTSLVRTRRQRKTAQQPYSKARSARKVRTPSPSPEPAPTEVITEVADEVVHDVADDVADEVITESVDEVEYQPRLWRPRVYEAHPGLMELYPEDPEEANRPVITRSDALLAPPRTYVVPEGVDIDQWISVNCPLFRPDDDTGSEFLKYMDHEADPYGSEFVDTSQELPLPTPETDEFGFPIGTDFHAIHRDRDSLMKWDYKGKGKAL